MRLVIENLDFCSIIGISTFVCAALKFERFPSGNYFPLTRTKGQCGHLTNSMQLIWRVCQVNWISQHRQHKLVRQTQIQFELGLSLFSG
ncbi:hypothetical protein AV530_004955 [Patagioenas fasciata monilis]|uniref:Uncharacterized protein n=1 Tax=Patagioenas fasciata monilis TaxID=372326 RepID=A0A1V4K3G1_PATFA|nr:hypothetical protein AV530_004955 [Patagioenas fasciata monilis]